MKHVRGEAGFTLVEICISMVLLLVALLLAAQILMETSQLFAETSGEALDAPVPLVIARMRADILGSRGVIPILDDDETLIAIAVQGLDQRIVYQKDGENLFRTVVPLNGDPPEKPMLLWRGVTGWDCQILRGNLVELAVTYRRHTVPHSPLPHQPGTRGPLKKELTQKMHLLPRGGGLGDSW